MRSWHGPTTQKLLEERRAKFRNAAHEFFDVKGTRGVGQELEPNSQLKRTPNTTRKAGKRHLPGIAASMSPGVWLVRAVNVACPRFERHRRSQISVFIAAYSPALVPCRVIG